MIRSRQGHVQYRVYEVDENKQTFLMHQGTDLYSLNKLRIMYGAGAPPVQGAASLSYLIMDIKPMVMKKNVLFRSPLYVINKCRHHVQLHFVRSGRRIYTMQAVEDNILPVPVDLLDAAVDIDISNISKKIEASIPAMALWGVAADTTQSYTSNEMFSVSLYTDADADCKYLYFCPPLILKNMFIKDLKLQLYRISMGREYSDDYELGFDSDTVEVYNTGSIELGKFKFRIETNAFISETIAVDLS